MSIHGSPVLHFPASALADLKARLASGHTISSVHEKGKHKPGDIVMSSLGMLRVLESKPVAPHELTAHSGAMKAQVAGGQGDMLELKKLGEAMTDTPAIDILADRAKTAGIGDFARNALMAGAVGSAGLAGGMGGHHMVASQQQPVAVVPSAMPGRSDVTVGGRPSDYRGYQHGAAHEIAGNMQDNQNALAGLGALGGAGGGAGAAALALLAARRQRPIGATVHQ